MAKRKKFDVIEPAAEAMDEVDVLCWEGPEPVPGPMPEPTPIVAESPDPRYTVHSWNASPLYRCTMCAFDAFDLARVLEHYDKYHRPVDIIPPLNQLDPEEIRARRRARQAEKHGRLDNGR
jgi:hypothetical protein